jgi:sec-independent protein translocase protein TatA
MFEGIFQPMHLLVILVIAMLVFGPKKLADLGKGLGQGIKEFKNAVNDSNQQPASTTSTVQSTTSSVQKENDKPSAN